MFFRGVEISWPDFRVEIEIRAATIGIEIDDVFQRSDAAVVHVRRGACDLAKRGRFEAAVILAFIREMSIAPRDAGVVKPFVAEVRTDMARAAIPFAAKDRKTTLFFRRERAAIAVHEPIVRRSTG